MMQPVPLLARAAARTIDFRMPEPAAVVYIIDDDESTREALRVGSTRYVRLR
jgi:hypothetical protein